jgi:CheY-like chemotaxis protein/HPt (histidine-containing phosphotransfer) domain-containing protein
MNKASAAVETVLTPMTAEFIDTCEDRLNDLDTEIRGLASAKGNIGDEMAAIKRVIHSIKGQAGTFGFPTVGHITNALEDYIEWIEKPSVEHLDDIQVYLDAIHGIIESREYPIDKEAERILHDLLGAVLRMAVSNPVRDVRVLLVMPKSVQRSIIGAELIGCGFKVRMADRAVEAIDMALAVPPHVVLAGHVLEDISGAELARVLATIGATRDCRFALVTTFGDAPDRLGELPPDTAVVRKGRAFVEDLTETLMGWGLFDAEGD